MRTGKQFKKFQCPEAQKASAARRCRRHAVKVMRIAIIGKLATVLEVEPAELLKLPAKRASRRN
jgi:hypothetical protein